MNKRIKINKGKVHACFKCETCGNIEWEDYPSARQRAYSHAVNTGHKVIGEIGYFYHYN